LHAGPGPQLLRLGAVCGTDLREDVKFSELVAAMLAALREMRLLEHRHAALSQFFSPVVLETLAQEDPEEKIPKKCWPRARPA